MCPHTIPKHCQWYDTTLSNLQVPRALVLFETKNKEGHMSNEKKEFQWAIESNMSCFQ
jgi:hypothetical protein